MVQIEPKDTSLAPDAAILSHPQSKQTTKTPLQAPQVQLPPTKKPAAYKEVGLLPSGYTPSNLDVLCGRGKGSRQHRGNKRFAEIIQKSLKDYSEAPRKIEKTIIVASIVDVLRDSGTLFVKKDLQSGRWYDIGNILAREKTGHAIRDYLAKRRRNLRSPSHPSQQPVQAKAAVEKAREEADTAPQTMRYDEPEVAPESVLSTYTPVPPSLQAAASASTKPVSSSPQLLQARLQLPPLPSAPGVSTTTITTAITKTTTIRTMANGESSSTSNTTKSIIATPDSGAINHWNEVAKQDTDSLSSASNPLLNDRLCELVRLLRAPVILVIPPGHNNVS